MRKKRKPGFLLFYSDRISDISSNFAEINPDMKRIDASLDNIATFYRKMKRKPTLSITPWSKPHRISNMLINNEWKLESTTAWMSYNKKHPNWPKNEKLTITEVESRKEMRIAQRVFNTAYNDKKSEETPYGSLSPVYGEKMFESYVKNEKKPKKEARFYLAYINDKPVGISLLVTLKGYTAIYNLGVIRKYRKQGIGTALIIKCLNKASSLNRRKIFLQTEAKTFNERFYRKLGFRREFTTRLYTK